MRFMGRLVGLAREALFHLSLLGLDERTRRYRTLLFHGHFYDVQTPDNYRFLEQYGKVHYFRQDGVWLVIGFDEVENALKADKLFTTKDIDDFKFLDPRGVLIRAEEGRHEEVVSIVREALMAYKKPSFIESFRFRLETIMKELDAREYLDFKREVTLKISIRSYAHLIGLTAEDATVLEDGFDDVDIMPSVRWQESLMRKVGIMHYKSTKPDSILSSIQGAIQKGVLEEEEGLDILSFFMIASTENISTVFQRIFEYIVSDSALRQQLLHSVNEHARFIEEVIRLHPPFPYLKRYCARENDLLGTTLPVGATLVLDVRGANRSSVHFEQPDRMSVDENRHRHLGFGSGLHKCVGMGMARSQSRLFLEFFLERAHTYEIVELDWLKLDRVNNQKSGSMRVRRRLTPDAVDA